MLEIVLSNQFKKDIKSAQKRGLKLELLTEVVDTLASQQSLPEKYRDHPLTGSYADFRECHIKPDCFLFTELITKIYSFSFLEPVLILISFKTKE